MMNGFGSAFFLFYNISQTSRVKFAELVVLLLSFPCFKASNFFFKMAYRLNQRRLFRLRVGQRGLYRKDLLVELDGIFEELGDSADPP